MMNRSRVLLLAGWVMFCGLVWGAVVLRSRADANVPSRTTVLPASKTTQQVHASEIWTHAPMCRRVARAKGAVLDSLPAIRHFHRQHVVFDWHVDTLYHLTKGWYPLSRGRRGRDVDVPKMRRGGIGAQVFAMWVSPRKMRRPGEGWAHLKLMYRNFQRLLRENRNVLEQARTVADIRRIRKQGKIAALLAIEGAHPLEGKLRRVKTIASWGVVYVGLTWNNSNEFATSARDEWYRKGYRKRGLTPKGRRLVRLLERHRILVDVSHSGRKTFWDIAKMSRRPFIASHSDAYAIRPHYRNLSDAQLRALAKHNGLVGANFYPLFLRKRPRLATIQDVVRHIVYMVKIAGIDHVALGSDFDGITSRPRDLEHIGKLPNLTRALWKHGFRHDALRKILGGNSLRVLGAR